MSRQNSASSLYKLCLSKTVQTYTHFWKYTEVLPESIQRDLLVEGLLCNEDLPISDTDDNCETCLSMSTLWSGTTPFTSETFVHLFTLPDEIPPFAYEKNHILFNYIIEQKRSGINQIVRRKRLCKPCFLIVSEASKCYSMNLWLERNVSYLRISRHTVADGEDLLKDIIWDLNNWCERCTIEPLFKIIDDDECFRYHNYHLKRRTSWSDSSTDDDVPTVKKRLLVGNRMCPDLYKCMRNLNNSW